MQKLCDDAELEEETDLQKPDANGPTEEKDNYHKRPKPEGGMMLTPEPVLEDGNTVIAECSKEHHAQLQQLPRSPQFQVQFFASVSTSSPIL